MQNNIEILSRVIMDDAIKEARAIVEKAKRELAQWLEIKALMDAYQK